MVTVTLSLVLVLVVTSVFLVFMLTPATVAMGQQTMVQPGARILSNLPNFCPAQTQKVSHPSGFARGGLPKNVAPLVLNIEPYLHDTLVSGVNAGTARKRA
jgi:hypothetical protein